MTYQFTARPCSVTQKCCQFGQYLFIWANISETVYANNHVCMKHIYKVVYGLSVYLITFDL